MKQLGTGTVRSNLAELIATKAKDRGGEEFTLTEISHDTRLSVHTIRLYMRGELDRFEARTIAILCNYLGCGIEDLLKIVDEADSTQNPSPLQ